MPAAKASFPSILTCATANVIWYLLRRVAERTQLDDLALHDLRRTCAELCDVNGGELEQIQFLLGHQSVLTPSGILAASRIWRSLSTIASVVFSLGRPWLYGKPCTRQLRLRIAEGSQMQRLREIGYG